MILYDFRCPDGHRFEAGLASMHSPDPDCPTCGVAARRVPSRVRMGGVADAGPSREQMPKSWQAIGGGHRDAVSHWRSQIEKREKLEEKHPELGGDRRPVLAHEGIFRDRPLRAGDDIPSAIRSARTRSTDSGAATGAGANPGATSTSRENA